MPRLNQNQRIQELTMLARGENVSNASRVFGCHRNTIIRLLQRFQQTGGVADRRRSCKPRVTNPQTDRFITHVRSRFQTATSSARQYGFSKQTVLRRLRQPGYPFGQGGPMWDKCLQHVIELPVYSGHNGISIGGDSSGLGFYSLMSLGLTLVIMTVEFEFLEGEGNVLLIIVSLRGTDLEVGGVMGRRKTNLIVVQGNLNARGYINQILQPEAVSFLQRHGPAILMHDNARPHVAKICRQFLNRNNVNVLPWPAVSPDMKPI